MSRKQLHFDAHAEQEANDIGYQFMDSNDVIGDMGRAYNTDFSSVTIHTDGPAAQRAESAGVDAFASGNDIFFGRGAFNQNDPASRGLLAHELAHTMQQGMTGGGMGAGGMGVQTSAPQGAEQGGILDIFRKLFRRKKKPDGKTPEGRAGLIQQTAIPEARVGTGNTAIDENGQTPLDKFRAALNDGYMDSSNARAQEGKREEALVNLGIRESTKAPAKAESAMRGDIYSGLGNDYADYIYKLQESGLDTAAMVNNETSSSAIIDNGSDTTTLKLAYTTGAGYDALNNKALDMFSNYALSDQSLEHIRKMMSGMGSADVFGGQQYGLTGASGFALQTLMNTVGGNASKAATDSRLNVNSKRVAVGMGRMMGSLPNLATMPEDKIPDGLMPLRQRYIQLQEELDRRLQGQ